MCSLKYVWSTIIHNKCHNSSSCSLQVYQISDYLEDAITIDRKCIISSLVKHSVKILVLD